MPTFASINLPKTKEWNEFEEICLSVSKIRWKNPNFTRHGRPGQKQDGVDIYGKNEKDEYIGIQCKNTILDITKSIIDNEIILAEKFIPKISVLYIATSANSDKVLQQHVRVVSEKRKALGKFVVQIIFWNEIEQELGKERNELKRFYPQFFIGDDECVVPIDQLKRNQDIQQINDLLSYIDIEGTQSYLRMAPLSVSMDFLGHVDCFDSIIENPTFKLHDKVIHKYLNDWLDSWRITASMINSAPYDYRPNSDRLHYIIPLDVFRNKDEEKRFHEIGLSVKEFFRKQELFCQQLHSDYPEIDIRLTSKTAREYYSK